MASWRTYLPRRRDLPRLAVEAALAGAALLLALAGVVRILPALILPRDQIDFGAYYVAARVLNGGALLYQPEAMALAAGGAIRYTEYIYPPFLAVLLRPLALLPYRTAEQVWALLGLACLIAALVLLARVTATPRRGLAAIIPLALLFPAVPETLLLGQANLLLLALLVGALWASLAGGRRAELVAGALLGLAAAIKLYPVLIVLVYALRRRWAAVAGALGGLAAAFALGLAGGGGWGQTARWLFEVLPSVSAKRPFPSNQSVHAVLGRLFSANQFTFPALSKDNVITIDLRPLVDAPTLGATLGYLCALVILAATALAILRQHQRGGPLALSFGLLVAAALLVTPVVWDNYFVLLLIPIMVLASAARQTPALRAPLLAACLLLVLQRYWRWIAQSWPSPWLMMFGCLGALLIWLACLYLAAARSGQQYSVPK